MRTEVAEDVDKFVKRREIELDEINKRWDLALDERPFDADASDTLRLAAELATKKLKDAWAVRDTFRSTPLADFKLPAPSPMRVFFYLFAFPEADFRPSSVASASTARFRTQNSDRSPLRD